MAARRLRGGPRARVEAIRRSLPDHLQWDERELVLLRLADSLAYNVERLEQDVDAYGVRLADGRLNTALCELRQQEVALARVLGQLDIPESTSPRVVHGRKAAEARWRRAG